MNAEVEQVLRSLVDAFELSSDAAAARGMQKYMRDQFTFLGIASPVRKNIQTPMMAKITTVSDALVLSAELWRLNEREYQYAACDVLRKVFGRKKIEPYRPTDAVAVLETLITQRSWWDTVDALAPTPVYRSVMDQGNDALESNCWAWINSGNMWLQRTALICQLKAKERTDAKLLFAMVQHIAGSPEFFLRKGAGWALREYSKVDPTAVRTFIDANAALLSPLTIKEGGKYC